MVAALKVWMDALATRKQSTRVLYSQLFERFCKWVDKSPDELRELKFQENQRAKPWERSEVENLVRRYLEYLREKEGLKNLNNHYYSIRSFFSCNGLPLNLNGGDTPTNHNVQGSSVPTREDVKAVVSVCEHIRDRLMILFLKDSGLRTSDLEGIKWADLKPIGEGFYGFELVTRKRGVLARGFIGPETSKVLELYKRKRLQGTRRRLGEKNIQDHPVFVKMTRGGKGKLDECTALPGKVMTPRLSNIFKSAGLQDKGVSAHGLRKFWEQHVHASKESYVKQLNGRALTKSEKAYDWLTREQLFDIYKQNYQQLECLGSPMIRQEDIERIVEQRVAERVAQLNMHAKEVEAKSHRDIEDLKHQLKRVDRVEMQLAQLFTQQKAGLFIPRKYEEEAFTEIMGSRDKAREVLAKLAEIRKKRKS